MKKITSLLLIILLLLQVSFYPVSAKSYDSESAKNLLVSLGVIGKYEFEPEEEITRAVFASLAVKTMNKLDEASVVSGNKFSDVNADDEYAAEIYYLDSMDVMIGDDSGKFHPYDKLMMKDAVKAVVTMLNYGAEAKRRGGYPVGYMNKASALGLTKGLTKNQNEILTADEAVILLANALNTEMLQQAFEDGDIVYKTIKGETLLYKAFDCVRGEGYVTANDKTTLEAVRKGTAGSVVIGGKTFNKGTTDIDKMLGYYVEYYAVESDSNEDSVIVAYEVPSNKNNVLELKSDIITDETTNQKIVYEYKNTTKNAKIAPAADVIYNGLAVQGVEAWQFMPDSGNVTLFDTNDDKLYDVVKIDSYINYVLDKPVQGSYIVDKYMQPSINLDEDEWKEISVSLSGKDVALSDLKEWDVLSVKTNAEKLNENGFREIDFENAEYIEIYVSRNEVSGKADKVDKKEGTVTVGFNEYKLSQNLKQAEKNDGSEFKLPNNGDALSLILDINGVAAAIKTSGFAKQQYGFLVKTIVDNDESPAAVYLKIYTGEKGIVKFKCKERFRLDGESGTDTVWADELINKPQLISFKINSEGLISSVDTGRLNAAYENKKTSLVLGKSYSQARHKSTSRVFAVSSYDVPEFYVDGSVQIFRVPSKTNILNNDYSEEDFQVVALSYFEDNKRYDIDTYNVSEAMLPEIVVAYVDNNVAGTVSSSAKRVMIDNADLGIDENDEEIIYLSGYYRGTAVQYTFKKRKLADEYIDSSGNILLKRGDVILIDANDNNEITALSMEYKFSDSIANKHVYGGGIESKPTHFGVAYAKSSNALIMKLDAAKTALENDMLCVFPISSSKDITLYDSVTNRVSVIKSSDVLCEKDIGSKAYLLLVQMGQDGQAKDLIVYKMN